MGLSLNFWNQEVFRKLGDSCGGLVAVDGDIANFTQLQWARLLVKTDERDLPGSLHLVVGSLCFAIQLWWEVLPWVSVAVAVQGRGWLKGDKGCMDSHVGSSVGHSGVQGAVEEDRVEQVGAVFVEYGLGMAGGTEVGEGNDGKGKGVVKVSGDGLEGVVLRGKGNGLSVRWAELVKGGNIKLLGAYEVC